MSQQNNELAWAVVIAAPFFMVAGWVSKALGAEFFISLQAVVFSFLAVGCVIGIRMLVAPIRWSVLSSFAAMAVWKIWWPVLDSMAGNGSGSHKKMSLDDPFYMAEIQQSFWWNEAWFKWSVEAFFFVVLAICIYQGVKRR